jgi:hypothetical protein
VACAFATDAASAGDRAAERRCPSAEAGPGAGGDTNPTGRVYRGLTTVNLSCRKGAQLMDAFADRYGWPPADSSFTARLSGYTCKSQIRKFDENGRSFARGTVKCRRGDRKLRWIGSGSTPTNPGASE